MGGKSGLGSERKKSPIKKDVVKPDQHGGYKIVHIFRQDGWNGREDESVRQWTFTGALFYSIVCVTTIGYGDQTPKTASGT